MPTGDQFSSLWTTAEKLSRVSRQLISNVIIEAPLYDPLMLLHVKSHRMLKSSTILSRGGYAIEAESFMRSTLEILITVKYLLRDPERHVDMYRTFRWVERWNHAQDAIQGAELSLVTGLLESQDPARHAMAVHKGWHEGHRDEYEAAISKRNSWAKELKHNGQRKPKLDSWSLKSNFEMARDAGIDHLYLNLYGSLSELVHPSTLSAAKYLNPNGKMVVEPSEMKVRETMLGVCGIHVYVTQTIADFYDEQAIWDECEAVVNDLAQCGLQRGRD